jgi:hypothetical protein
MIVLIDFIAYWLHRVFQGKNLWRFHEVHHSSMELDWLAAARVHPVNDIANKSLQAMIIVVLGYAPALLAGALAVLHGVRDPSARQRELGFSSVARGVGQPFIAGIIPRRKRTGTKTLPGCCRSGMLYSASPISD